MRFNQRTRNKSIRIVSMACIRSESGSNIYEYLWIYEIKIYQMEQYQLP